MRSGSPGVPLDSAVVRVIRSIAVFPYHNPYNRLYWAALPVSHSSGELLAGILILLAGVLLAGWLAHRRQWFPLALACAPLVAVALGAIAVSRAGSEPYAFITAWLAFVPYLILIAAGVAVVGARPSITILQLRVNIAAMLAATAIACSGLIALSTLQEISLGSIEQRPGPRALAVFTRLARSELRTGDRWVGISIQSEQVTPVVAGLVLELERVGYHTTVNKSALFLLGEDGPSDHPVQIRLSFYLSSDVGGAQRAQGPVVGNLAGVVMTAQRYAG